MEHFQQCHYQLARRTVHDLNHERHVIAAYSLLVNKRMKTHTETQIKYN